MSNPELDAFLAKSGKTPVTFRMLNAVLDGVLGELVKTAREQKAELAQVKAELAELSTKALKGGAAWARGVEYAVSDCVQHDGSIWRCVEPHTSGATFAHDCFLLQIKRGRDGRDAR